MRVNLNGRLCRMVGREEWVIRIPTSGGKAGKGRNKTGTVQVLVDQMLRRQYRFRVGDQESLDRAWARALALLTAAIDLNRRTT